MTADRRYWLRSHAGKLLVGGAGALLTLSVFALGSALLDDGSTEPDDEDALVQALEADLAVALHELKVAHTALQTELASTETDRVSQDEAVIRSLLLSLTDSSASSRSVARTQALLDARYEFLDHESRVLTEFVPGWMTATGSMQGAGTVYALAGLDLDVRGVQGLDYSYVGVARLDPVEQDENSTTKSEFVVFTCATAHDGTVTSLDAYRASNRTRDVLVAARNEDESAETGMTPTADPSSDQGG
ncbi:MULTISPECIES: hypothetical protein [Promicromonospora]|uniref:Uncharacterized protein n=2 Tax=Promicromonospora TaxID=43676 RepID=A0ABW4V6B9_9MICO